MPPQLIALEIIHPRIIPLRPRRHELNTTYVLSFISMAVRLAYRRPDTSDVGCDPLAHQTAGMHLCAASRTGEGRLVGVDGGFADIADLWVFLIRLFGSVYPLIDRSAGRFPPFFGTQSDLPTMFEVEVVSLPPEDFCWRSCFVLGSELPVPDDEFWDSDDVGCVEDHDVVCLEHFPAAVMGLSSSGDSSGW